MPHAAFSTAPRSVTLAASVVVGGVGLFTGKPVKVTLRPAAEGAGVFFRRGDLAGAEGLRPIEASPVNIVPEARRTVLCVGGVGGVGGATVQTVEHLLSALRGLGVSDVEVDVDGPELPIGDGSAELWVSAMRGVGFARAGEAARPPIVVREPVRIAAGGAVVEALPLSPSELEAAGSGAGPATFYSYHLDFSNFPIPALAPIACKRVPAQSASIALPLNASEASIGEYAMQVAPARTFSLIEEAQAARQAGLFQHVSPRDLLVIGDAGPIDNAYRFADEPARHKLLDLIGDLALCGRMVVGRIVATRSGHGLNQELAKRLSGVV